MLVLELASVGDLRSAARSRAELGQAADMLAKLNLTLTVVDSQGRELARAGSGVDSRVGRALFGSPAIEPTLHMLRLSRA